VSIKKKFATAVATASLLAGLFGSAFVPSALAAREGSVEETPIARYTEISDLGDDILDNSYTDADGDAVDATKWGMYSEDSDDVLASNEAEIGITLFYAGASGAGTEEVTEIDMQVESSTSKIKVAIRDGATCLEMDDTDGGGGDTALDYFAQSDSVSDLSDGDAGEYYFCVAADKATTAAVGTITVKARAADSTGAYVTVAVIPFQVLGELSSLEASITDGYKYIVNDNDPLADWLTVVGKDSAGNILNGGTGTITQYEDIGNLDNWEDNPDNWEDEQIDFLDETTFDYADDDGDVVAATDTQAQLYSVNGDVCVSNDDSESTGSEGKSYTVKIESGDGDVVSNGITFTCTDGDAVVTKVTPEATSGDKDYDEGGAPNDDLLSLTASVVDSAGRPFGDGSTVACDDFTWADIVYTSDDLDEAAFGTGDIVGGECEVTTLDPDVDRFGKFTYTLKATYPDLGDASAAASTDKSFVLSYRATGTVDTVTIARVRNAAKTSATITFDGGEGAAFESVYFQVEKANGAVVEYRRRANGDGIARLVLSRRNTTIYVYAFAETGDESDTIKVTFK
jgi:hypothetical protein